MDAWSTFHGNPSNSYPDSSIKIYINHVVPLEKMENVKKSPKLLGFIVWGP